MEKYSEQDKQLDEFRAKYRAILSKIYKWKSQEDMLKQLITRDFEADSEAALKAEILKRSIN